MAETAPTTVTETGPAYKPAATRPDPAPVEPTEGGPSLSLLEVATNAILVPAGAVSMTAATFGTTGLIVAGTAGALGGGAYVARNREAIAATAKRAVTERRTTTTTTGGQRGGSTTGRSGSLSPRAAGRAARKGLPSNASKAAKKNTAHRARSSAGAGRKAEARKAASNAVRAAAAKMAATPNRPAAPKRLAGHTGTTLRSVSGGTSPKKSTDRAGASSKRSAGGGGTKARGGLLRSLKAGRKGTPSGPAGATGRSGTKTGKTGKTRKGSNPSGGLKNRISNGLTKVADKIDNSADKRAAKQSKQRIKRSARRTKLGRARYVRKATRWLRYRRNLLRGLGSITGPVAALATVFKRGDGGPLYRMWQGIHSKTRELLGRSNNEVAARVVEAKERYDSGADTHWRPGTASDAIAGGITINRNTNTGGKDMTNVNATALESLAEALALLENYSAQHIGEQGAALTQIGVGETGAKMQQMIAQSMFRMARASEQIPHTGPAISESFNGAGRAAHNSYESGMKVAQTLRKRFSVEIERNERGDKSLNVQ